MKFYSPLKTSVAIKKYKLMKLNTTFVIGYALGTYLLPSTLFAAPGLTMEKFSGVSGPAVSNLTSSAAFYSAPNPSILSSSSIPSNAGDNYGTRIRGYITAPVSGAYIFWESGDDAVQLFLSPDENPELKQLIAFHSPGTSPQQWDKYPTQKSRLIPLEAGRKYYIEALHKEGTGSDHLSIAWTPPGAARTLIPLSTMETFDVSIPSTGEGLTLQTFENIAGSYVADLTSAPIFPHSPENLITLPTGQAPADVGDNFGSRVRGWVVPQVSGSYNFWVSGDSRVELFLAPSGNPSDKQKIATCANATAPLEWTKYTSQKSRSLTLTAGNAYYIEILHKESTGADHFAVAWTPPNGTLEILPSSVLRTWAPHPTDLDDDQVADAQETALGLDPERSADGYADLDDDGIPNFIEYARFSNPAIQDSVDGCINDHIWFNIPGGKLNLLSYMAAAARPFDARSYLTCTQSGDVGDNYVRRYRGFITAPVTGSYQFWMTADDDGELYLSTSASKFGLVQIINSNVVGGGTEFDLDPSQKSMLITLQSGQKYYFEMWHKEASVLGDAAIAWKIPGGSRQIIPSHYLSSFCIDADDLDDDDVPDSYEVANGLDPNNDGRSVGSADGAYGDLDGDGIMNRDEWKYETAANLTDSDGDGVSDWDEINFFGSATLANAIGAFTHVATLSGDSYINAIGDWNKQNGTAQQSCRRGSVTYQITVPTNGIYALKFNVSSILEGSKSELHDFHLKLNGKHLAYKTISILPGETSDLALLTPWLQAGQTYDLELFVDNSYNFRRVSINQLQVSAAGGIDSNQNGTPDWVDIRIHDTNGFDSTNILSKTSPATVEGKAKHISFLDANGTPATKAPDGRFFTEVPLTYGVPSTLDFAFENGALNQTATVQWLPTNLLHESSMTIRQGDSLLLTAFVDAENADLESYAITVNGQTYTQSSAEPSQVAFDTVGVSTVQLSHTDAGGKVTTSSVTFTVLPRVSINPPTCIVGYSRNWTHPALPSDASIVVDSQVQSHPEGTLNTLVMTTLTPINQPLLVKTSTGLILGSGEIKSASMRSSDQTGVLVIEKFPTYEILRMPVIVYGDLGNVQILCQIIIGGVTYTDGSTTKILTKDSFDSNDQFDLLYKKPLSAHSNCHEFIFQ